MVDQANIDVAEKVANLRARSDKERRRFYARQPKAVGQVVAKVVAKRGYAAVKASGDLQDAWNAAAAGVLTDQRIVGQTRAGGVSRGRLEVLVANHVVMQETSFFKPQLLRAVQEAAPDARITSLRFKVARF